MTRKSILSSLLEKTAMYGPVLVVIAGPNGAGKSTFYEEYLASLGLPYVNADVIVKEALAKGKKLSDYDAARIAEERRRKYVERKESFCFETVFSDRVGSKLRFLKDAQDSGYAVTLIFIGLENVEVSRARVLQRVSAGGHSVSDKKIEGRFPRTFDNLCQAIGFVDQLFLLDNSSYETPYRPVAVFRSGETTRVFPSLPPWARKILSVLIRKP